MKHIILLLIFLPFNLNAQFADDFTDSNLTMLPAWLGDTADFTISANYLLQLNADRNKSSSWLYTASQAVKNASWEWYSELAFNPSSSNYYKVYLMRSRIHPDSGGAAYFVKVGGKNDEVSLYYEQNNKPYLLIDGKNKRLNTNPVTVRISVERDEQGLWELYTDSSGGFSFQSEGSVHHDSLTYSTWFGIQCFYSSTRANRFYFDEFKVIGQMYPDTHPPQLLELQARSPYNLQLTFNETVDSSFSKKPYLINVNHNIGLPVQVKALRSSRKQFSVTFPNAFLANKEYTLSLTFRDTTGNQSVRHFSFIHPVGEKAKPRDVVINELMVDPTPPIGLPECEYVELYNSSDKFISVDNWILTDNDRHFVFPNLILPPKQYWIIGAKNNEAALVEYGEVVASDDFPGLNNSNDTLYLYDGDAQLIDRVAYSSSWYKDTKKANGGWSLERINPNFQCNDAGNWSASSHSTGGTPGSKNSIFHTPVDQDPPELISALVWNRNELQVLLSEPIDTTVFKVNPMRIDYSPVTIWDYMPVQKALKLYANDDLIPGKHTVYFPLLTDCRNNTVQNSKLTFEVASKDDPEGIVINELLFDPAPGGSDFVELYNASSKLYDLRHWKLGNAQYELDSSRHSKVLSKTPFLFPPKSYVVLTEDSQSLKLTFPYNKHRIIIQTELPSYGNDTGEVVLFKDKLVIDRVKYRSDQHLPSLYTTEGVSLERIRPQAASSDPTNWISASHTTNYGTPGYRNSQFFGNNTHNTETFSMPFPIFSPDNDGFRDVIQFNYLLPAAGYSGTVAIYNEQGFQVKELLDNNTLSTEGSIHWNGIGTNGTVSPVGIYIFHYQLYRSGGNHLSGRLPFVLARTLR